MNTSTLVSRLPGASSPADAQCFVPHDPQSVWIVRAGAVDLFLEIADPQGGACTRQPVLRLNEGNAIFGLARVDPNIQLVAVPLPQTEVERMPLLDVQQQLTLGTESAQEWLEDWILNLNRVCSRDQAPGSVISLNTGTAHTISSKAAAAIAPVAGVVWVRHKKGDSLFLGLEDPITEDSRVSGRYRIDGAGLFPVSKAGWLLSSPRSVIEVFETRAISILDTTWESVVRYHSFAFSRLVANCQVQMQLRRERIRTSLEADGRNMQASLSRLASPLAEVANYSAEASRKVVDPTYIACYTAAKTAGIELKPHPGLYQGVTLSDPIPQIARASGVRFRRVALRGKWWQVDGGPMVAFREKDNSPVALLPKSPTQYDLFDPVTRTTQRVNADIALALSPVASVFYRPFPAKALHVWDVFRFGLTGCRRDIATILWSGLGIAILSMALPFATSFIFDSYIPAADRAQLEYACIFLAFVALASSLLMVARGFATLRLEGKMDASLQAALWDRLLNLPAPFFRDFSSGDLAMRSLGILQIRRVLTGSALSSILSGIFSIFSLALLFYYSWRLALMAIGLLVLAFFVSGLCGYVQVRIGRTIFQMRGATTSLVSQFITGMPKLRVAGAESRAFSAWANQFAVQRQLTLKARKASNLLRVFTSVYPIVCQAVLFFYHSYLLTDPTVPTISTGAFLGFLAAFTQVLLASLLLSSSITAALDVIPLYERAEPILKALPEKNETGEAPAHLAGTIEANSLTFRYKPDAPLVLRGISFRVEPGQFVAFVGASGCGKSTLFRLLLGFESPESGALYYDEKDLSGLDVQAVRQHLGVVLQSSKLSSGTVLSNIIGSSNLTVNDAWEAARLAGVQEDIKLMPMGMHTAISDGGGGFSGGQRQRLLIARAIVNKPRILLFDEATSALDNATQSAVSKSLESFRATRIVIAHRLSTIQNADCIYVLDKGRIVQQGKYADLMGQEGLFRDLAQRQIL